MASIRREIPAAAGWCCSTWRNYTGGCIWRGGNSGMAQPNYLEGLAGESCVGHLVLHHHPQAESHSGCHSFLEHLSGFVGILLHQDVDQISFQMWHLEYSLHTPGEHCHPNLCCFLLWPCLQWWGLSILPLLLPPPIWHLCFFSPPSWMLGFFLFFRFCEIVIITATPDSQNRVFFEVFALCCCCLQEDLDRICWVWIRRRMTRLSVPLQHLEHLSLNSRETSWWRIQHWVGWLASSSQSASLVSSPLLHYERYLLLLAFTEILLLLLVLLTRNTLTAKKCWWTSHTFTYTAAYKVLIATYKVLLATFDILCWCSELVYKTFP